MRRLMVISAFICVTVLVSRPHTVSAASDLTRRSQPADDGSTDRPPPSAGAAAETEAEADEDYGAEYVDIVDEPGMLLSGCDDYESTTDRFYIRELIEDVDGDHVIVTTHYGQLRGVRINGIPAAGEHDDDDDVDDDR